MTNHRWNDPATLRVLAAVSEREPAARAVVDAASQVCDERGAELFVLFVEPKDRNVPEEIERSVRQVRHTTEARGGVFLRRFGDHPAIEILNTAQSIAAGTIVMGEGTTASWKRTLFGSLVETIRRAVSGVDVVVVREQAVSAGNTAS